ncbi:MAG TPA: VOC family protein [Stellaceae bacterium]|nr:VOC family protein [Stellaceae bacterium]
MLVTPYLSFDGQCEAAFKFYERYLNGNLVALLTYGDSPMADQVPPERRGKIMHARLALGDAVLMGGDCPQGQYRVPQGFTVTLGIDDPDEAERVFTALSEGGSVQMPLQETFWAARFGMLIDRFGIPWMINCERAA